MGDLTVGAIIFLIVVWALILGTTGITLKLLLSHEDSEESDTKQDG